LEELINTYQNIKELTEEEQKLIDSAKSACNNAYAPYSQFNVGAALLLDDGSIVIGSNQENAAYPSGLCAERVAIFSVMNNNPTAKIKKIAVTARKATSNGFIPAAPCGGCRQVMLEQEQKQNENIEVLFSHEDKWVRTSSIKQLLPFSFNKNSLK